MQQDNFRKRSTAREFNRARRCTWDRLSLADLSNLTLNGSELEMKVRRPNEADLLLLEVVSSLECNGALASRIRELVSDGADVNYQHGEERLSALHILCRHRMWGPEWQSPWLAAFHSLLSMGADVTLEDAEGNTPLLTALSYQCPVAATTHLIDMTTVNLNKTNINQNTALHILLIKGGEINTEILRSLVRAGADVTAVGKDNQTPLQLILDRPERECVSLLNLVQQYQDTGNLLSFIIAHGTAVQAQVLLKQCYGCGVKVEAALIVTAAGADCDPWEKIELLVESGIGIDTVCSMTGENILHRAATSDNVQVLKNAFEKGVPHIADNAGDFPIHRAAGSAVSVDCLMETLRQEGHLKDATNQANETPLSLAVRMDSKDKVVCLLNFGCMPKQSKRFKHVCYEELSKLADPHVIAQSPQPLLFTLQMVKVFKKAALQQDTYWRECHDTADEMVALSIDLVDGSKEFPADSVLNYALDQRLKKFVACTTIQQRVAQSWYETGHTSGFRKVKFVQEVILYLFLFPFFSVRCLSRFFHSLTAIDERHVKISVQYAAYVFSYFIMYLLLVATVLWNISHLRCDNLVKLTGCRPSGFDWSVFVFVIGLDAQEWLPVGKNNNGQTRFFSFDSLMQFVSNVLLNVYFILLFTGFYADLSISARELCISISYDVISVALGTCMFRFLQLRESSPLFGTLLISFRNMFVKIFGYVIFFIILLVTTACSITGFSAAEKQRLGVIGNSTGQPLRIGRFVSSLRDLFFSLYGLTDVDAFTSSFDKNEHSQEEDVVIFVYGMWLTMISIFYLSMLIAYVSNAYQAVEDNSEIEQKFAKTLVVRQMRNSPLRPLPLNLLYYVIKFTTDKCTTCKTLRTPLEWERLDTAVIDCASQRRMMACFLDKAATRDAERPAAKKDLAAVHAELDALKHCSSFTPSSMQNQLPDNDTETATLLLKLDASVAALVDTVKKLETRLSKIEAKFDDTMV